MQLSSSYTAVACTPTAPRRNATLWHKLKKVRRYASAIVADDADQSMRQKATASHPPSALGGLCPPPLRQPPSRGSIPPAPLRDFSSVVFRRCTLLPISPLRLSKVAKGWRGQLRIDKLIESREARRVTTAAGTRGRSARGLVCGSHTFVRRLGRQRERVAVGSAPWQGRSL